METLLNKPPKKITERNAWFAGLTAQEKRIAIAHDVIKLLRAPKIKIKSANGYFDLHMDDYKKMSEDDQIQDYLNKRSVERCTMCAMGAMMYSKISLGNSCTIGDSTTWIPNGESYDIEFSGPSIVRAMKGIFPEKQLRLMEMSFEADSGAYSFADKIKAKLKAFAFGESYGADNNRLKAIMQNVIDNNGTFKP